jgi:hypothetical protein
VLVDCPALPFPNRTPDASKAPRAIINGLAILPPGTAERIALSVPVIAFSQFGCGFASSATAKTVSAFESH